jgi:hypothetical protein
MRKRIGIGVVAAALLFGLVLPGVDGGAGDQVVTAGVGSGAGETIGFIWRGLRAVARFLGHNGGETEAAMRRLEGLVRTRLHEGKLTDRLQWKLIDVACTAKDVDELRRKPEVETGVWTLAAELPDPIGVAASVYNLANDLAKAKDSDERAGIRATAQFCARAGLLAHG